MSNRRCDDLVRALNLIPYLRSHPSVTLFEMAKDLGRSYAELKADLERLHTSGVGIHVDDLIDLQFNDAKTEVTITEDQGMDVPLRLTRTEAGALLLMLESLETRLPNNSAITSAAAKIRAHTGVDAVHDSQPYSSDPDLAAVNDALFNGKQLSFRYWSASKAEYSTRRVDPINIVLRDRYTYLTAFDHGADELRTFRVDRISEAHPLADPVIPRRSNPDDAHFAFEHAAEIEIRADSTWLAEYHDISLGDRQGEWVKATLRYASDEWLKRFILGNADRLRLKDPAAVRDVASRRARATLAGYGH